MWDTVRECAYVITWVALVAMISQLKVLVTLLTEPESSSTSAERHDEDKYLKTSMTKGEIIRNQLRTKAQISAILLCYAVAIGLLKGLQVANKNS